MVGIFYAKMRCEYGLPEQELQILQEKGKSTLFHGSRYVWWRLLHEVILCKAVSEEKKVGVI